MIKVFLGGEGNNDIGTRWYHPMGDTAGVVEVLLRRIRPTGWDVAGARLWKSIRKYRAGAATRRAEHADAHNVRGLVQEAYEHACEMLVFVRDGDGDELREREIRRTLDDIAALGFVQEFSYALAIVGGVPRPKLEGWILCLRGVAGTDAMTGARVDRELATTSIALKSGADYVAMAEACPLPTGDGSLARWLARADLEFCRLIDGVGPSSSQNPM